MNFLTHIAISKIVYSNIKTKVDLNKYAFIFGNVKPDLSSNIKKNPHILDNHLSNVCGCSSELMEGKESLRDFSIELGQICHYVCDFFCQYHLDLLIFNNLRDHFFYELKLQYVLNKMTRNGRSHTILMKNKAARKDIESIIFEMRNSYMSEVSSVSKDISYAISTAIWVCESISYYLVKSTETIQDIELDFYDIIPLTRNR